MTLLTVLCTVALLWLVSATEVWDEVPASGYMKSNELDPLDAPLDRQTGILSSKMLGRKVMKRFLDNIVKDIADTAKDVGEIANGETSCTEKASLCTTGMEGVDGTGSEDTTIVCKKYAEVMKCQKEVYDKCTIDIEKPAIESMMKSFEETNKGTCDKIPKDGSSEPEAEGANPTSAEPADSEKDPCSLINRATCTEKHSSAMQANSLTCQNVTEIKQCYMDLKPQCKYAEKGAEIDNELKNYEVLSTTCEGTSQESKPEGSVPFCRPFQSHKVAEHISGSSYYSSGLVTLKFMVLVYFTL